MELTTDVEHVTGRPISVATYRNHCCRCPGCTAANAAAQRKARSNRSSRAALHAKVASRAQCRAAKWVRENHPEVWQRMREEALAELERDGWW